ncbi:MAG: gfo/Idh/MocA family oxidoreductase, partial [Ignavibacteria bacterium]|nr:gfo/Idh/MocA family oxidoreductase [Ignavibacteria bacterium]
AEIVKMKTITSEPEDPMAMVIDLGNGKGMREITFEKPDILPINAIKAELESFYEAIVNDKTPMVSIEDGYNVIKIAYQILEKVNQSLSSIK